LEIDLQGRGTRFARTPPKSSKIHPKIADIAKIADIVRNRKITLSLGAVGFNPVFFEFWQFYGTYGGRSSPQPSAIPNHQTKPKKIFAFFTLKTLFFRVVMRFLGIPP
jgi:hypothetical protein